MIDWNFTKGHEHFFAPGLRQITPLGCVAIQSAARRYFRPLSYELALSVRESVRDERIGHYDSDGNVLDLNRQLRFRWTGFIHVHHDRRRRIILERSQTDA
jgi:hypothetical protein